MEIRKPRREGLTQATIRKAERSLPGHSKQSLLFAGLRLLFTEASGKEVVYHLWVREANVMARP